MHRIGIGEQMGYQSVSRFMIGRDFLLFDTDNPALTLGACNHAVYGFGKLIGPKLFFPSPRRQYQLR